MPDLSAIRAEIEAGLPHERDRLTQSKRCVDFYRGEFDAYWEDVTPDAQAEPRRRPSLLMQWAVNRLGALYATGPAREVADDPAATAWLADLYAREGVDGLLQEADRLALAADVAAVQVVPTGDPDRPIRFTLWPAHQFIVWESEDDPMAPSGVGTLDFFDNRRRLRLYTPDWLATFRTEKTGSGQTAGGTAYRLDGDPEPNPFGVLPFAFVHANPPTTEFWSHGFGDALADVTSYLMHGLTETGEAIRYGLRPVVTIFGAGTWRPPCPSRPGDVWYLPAGSFDSAQNGVAASVAYLQPDPGFIEAEWADLQGGIDHALQAINLPPAAFRMVASSAASGVAIVAEQLPVLQAIEARQRPFVSYERQLARVALAVGGLDPALADKLRLRWPEIVPRNLLYGPDEDKADRADLDLGLTSLIQIAMRRLNLTREQAVDHLKQVAADREDEERIGVAPVPSKPIPTEPALAGQEDDDAQRSEERPDPGRGPGGPRRRPEPEG